MTTNNFNLYDYALHTFQNEIKKDTNGFYFQDENQILVLEKCIKNMEKNYCRKKKKGILIFGSSGSGKSLILRTLSKVSHLAKGIDRINVVKCNSIVNEFREKAFKGNYHSVYKRYTHSKNKSSLCLDELGMDKPVEYYGQVYNVLENILFQRAEKRLLTYASTNCKPETLRELYGERVFSRLHDLFEMIELIGDDYRIINYNR